jgi:hypothetical protein
MTKWQIDATPDRLAVLSSLFQTPAHEPERAVIFHVRQRRPGRLARRTVMLSVAIDFLRREAGGTRFVFGGTVTLINGLSAALLTSGVLVFGSGKGELTVHD